MHDLVSIDASKLSTRQINVRLTELIGARKDIEIINPKARHNIIDWVVLALGHHFGWGGHVSRLLCDQPQRITGKIMTFRDRQWLDLVEKQNHGRQLHGRVLRTWKWERPLVQYAASTGVSTGMI